MANRFALFAEDGEEPSPTVESTFQVNPFVNQVADNDAPWEKVKRGSKMSKPPPRTLVIRSKENKPPLTRFQPKSRDAPGPTFEANRMKAYDPYENWCGVCHTHLPNKNTLILHIKQSPQRHENYCNLCKRVSMYIPTGGCWAKFELLHQGVQRPQWFKEPRRPCSGP